MSQGFGWPDWLEGARVADSSLEAAYEQTPARWRSLLKAGIALAHFHYGQAPHFQAGERENRHAGYWQKIIKKPALWACLVFAGSEAAAAPVCASAILPVLANVPNICAVSCGTPGSRLLVCLELCGIEDVFALDQDQCAALMVELCSQNGGQGRICALNCEFLRPGFEQPMNVRMAFLTSPQNAFLKSPSAFNSADLEFCLGKTPATRISGPAQCIYVETPGQDDQEAELKLGPRCEGFWLFPGFGPEYYQQGSFCFGEIGVDAGPV